MLNFLLKKGTLKSVQRYIDKFDPKLNLHLHEDIPLPSIRLMKKFANRVAEINAMEEQMSSLSDDELKAKTDLFRQRYAKAIEQPKKAWEEIDAQYRQVTAQDDRDGLLEQYEAARESLKKAKKKTLDDILPEAFAVTREAGKRVLSMRHYDVQLVGGMVLHGGNITEMTTGEGKTLVATLAAYLNGLTGEGVHIVTVNDYLAKRDSEWMGPLFEFLGLSVGAIQHDMVPQERQAAYACDIVYGTNNEFGFDYLRDNMVVDKRDMVQGVHHFAIVDEVDSILIDEARTPLIISGPAEESTDKYYKANEIAKKLKGRRVTEKDEIDAKHKEINLSEGFDYLADEKAKSISLTDAGEEKAAQLFGVANLHDMDTIEYRHHILQALKAHQFFKIDVDYIVQEGQVVIVDEFTGRLMPGRRWSDGLHQAVESKEGIKIERENQTLATITFQNYFRLYDKLSGMTGTAETEATEFKQIYDLECVVIPTNKPMQRKNHADCIYKTLQEKFNAVVEEIADCHQRGQPVLVGTISIEKSELISRLLKEKGIEHQVLNAKFHELEAHIIAQAGRYKAVTIATNMAGRGTDIVLGGNAEYLAKSLVKEKLENQQEANEEELTQKFISQFKAQVKEEQAKVLEAGGLHVLGTERHESRRIDNQLRGRQGRQGDPGSSRFYVSLEDDLMRLFASDRIVGLMDKLGMEEGQVLEHPWLSKALENAQRRVESHNFEIRKHLLEYDNVMNRQREVVYDLRRSVLESDNVKDLILEAVAETLEAAVADYLFVQEQDEEKWDLEGLDIYLKSKFNYDFAPHKDALRDKTQEEVFELLFNDLKNQYDAKEEDIEPAHLRHIEKVLMLNTIDAKWKDHLYAMDQLKEGVGLRSFAQRDPLIEYKKEGFGMFQMMYNSINQEVAEIIFKIQPASSPSKVKGVFSSLPQNLVHKEASGMADARFAQQAMARSQNREQPNTPSKPMPVKSGPKVGRNDPCPCGSGKKYKKCCGK